MSKKKHQKLKVRRMLYTFYSYMCTILILCIEKVEKKNLLFDFFSNHDVFNYGSKIIFFFFLISIDNR